jgi:hypothetical protein
MLAFLLLKTRTSDFNIIIILVQFGHHLHFITKLINVKLLALKMGYGFRLIAIAGKAPL